MRKALFLKNKFLAKREMSLDLKKMKCFFSLQ